ncbi:MAG: YceI family protein [Chloroflexaceae bacterium]
MFQRIIASLMFVLFLAACGDSPQSAATVPTATSTAAAPTEAPTTAPTEVPTMEPTEVPTTAPTEAAAATEPAEDAATEPTEMPAVAPAEDAATEPTEMPAVAPAEDAATEPTETAQTDAASTAQRYLIVPTESEVRYEVEETFLREGNRLATAIGVTQEIEGAITVDPENPQNSTVGVITIDISAFTSDEDRRDQAIRDRWLESATYPIATFEPTEITGLPETYTEGEELSFQVTGDMTVRETTNPVTFDVTAQVMDGELVGTATTDIKMTDFGFDPPDIAGILRAEDDVRLIFDFVARPEA